MNALGATFTLFAVAVVLFTPRRWAALGVMFAVCYITQGQTVIVGGFHFHAIRIVLLSGVIRCLAKGEFRTWKFNNMDWALVVYASLMLLVPSLRTGSSEEFV